VLRHQQVLQHRHAAEQADVLERSRNPPLAGDAVAGQPLQPPLAAGLLIAATARPPDILISEDGRQVAVLAADGRLHALRANRGGFLNRAFADATAAPPGGRIADMPGARCSQSGCLVHIGSLTLIAFSDTPSADPASVCADADLVVAPFVLERCAPRWRLMDRAALRRTGAASVHSETRTVQTVADAAGDHAWSPAALPGTHPGLLGAHRWIGVLAE
jgi:competence protein ComEC